MHIFPFIMLVNIISSRKSTILQKKYQIPLLFLEYKMKQYNKHFIRTQIVNISDIIHLLKKMLKLQNKSWID